MADDNVDRKRRSIRLANYDYSQDGAYFLTLCAQARLSIFGQIVDGVMQLNECGSLVASEWCRTSAIRPHVALDEFVVMPNHFHSIVAIEGSRRGVLRYAHPRFQSPSQSLGSIVRGFKSATTTLINSMRNSPGAPVWQRNYYEHVIRNESELIGIREYIANNPHQWSLDRENPQKGVYQYAPTDGIEDIFGGIRP
ncbi:MAG: transposase [Candidatus Binatia bacterium]